MRMDVIGREVRRHRERAGLSREQLAKLSGVGKTVIFDIEHGKETVRYSSLVGVMEALNLKIRLESPLSQHLRQQASDENA